MTYYSITLKSVASFKPPGNMCLFLIPKEFKTTYLNHIHPPASSSQTYPYLCNCFAYRVQFIPPVYSQRCSYTNEHGQYTRGTILNKSSLSQSETITCLQLCNLKWNITSGFCYKGELFCLKLCMMVKPL